MREIATIEVADASRTIRFLYTDGSVSDWIKIDELRHALLVCSEMIPFTHSHGGDMVRNRDAWLGMRDTLEPLLKRLRPQ